MSVGLRNLGDDEAKLGQLTGADENLRRAIALCAEIGDEWGVAIGHEELGRLLCYKGRFDEGGEELEAALASFIEQGQVQPQCLVWAYRDLRALLMGDPDDALSAAREARRLADETARRRYPHERDFVRAEWLMGWALVALASEEESERTKTLADAEGHLTEALTRCRRINMVDHEPDILLAWGRWHWVKRQAEEALMCAQEALAIADRCEYRLVQAEIHNFLARLALDEGKHKAAKEHAEVAKERAWCDGPPHCYKPALEEAERLLEEAGKGA